ncbi:hypothetical protein, partial [Cupriavidus sp. CP313]
SATRVYEHDIHNVWHQIPVYSGAKFNSLLGERRCRSLAQPNETAFKAIGGPAAVAAGGKLI